jgi:predicted Zn finger-like uncharacterized protein
MKFLCGGCRTKYQISDEKIRSKILTIRCKKCGAKILVRESLTREAGGTAVAPLAEEEKIAVSVSLSSKERAAGAAVQAGGSAALASAFDMAMRGGEEDDDMPTSIAPTPANLGAAGVEWYVAIDGEQSGPFAFAEVVRRVQGREVVGRNYVWHDGMDGWKRVREVPDLIPYLGHDKKKPPPIPKTGEHIVGKTGPGADVVDFASKRKERDQKRGTHDIVSSDIERHDSPMESPTEGKVEARSPSRREEQLDHVLNEALGIQGEGATQKAAAEKAIAIQATAGIAGQAGLPQVPSVDDLLAFEKDGDIFANVPRASANELVKKEATRFFVAAAGVNRQKSRNKLGLMIGGIAGVSVLCFFVLWYTGIIAISLPGIGNPFDRTGQQEMDEYGVMYDPGDPEQMKKLLDEHGRPRKIPGRRRVGARVRGPDGQFIVDQPGDPSQRGTRDDGPTSVGIDGDLKIDGKIAIPDSALPASDLSGVPLPDRGTLSQDVISRVINERKKSVSICYQQSLRGNEDLRGKLEFAVTIEPSGEVSRASVETTAFKGTKLARCIAGKIKDWRFPKFAGDPQQVQVPFVLEKNSY